LFFDGMACHVDVIFPGRLYNSSEPSVAATPNSSRVEYAQNHPVAATVDRVEPAVMTESQGDGEGAWVAAGRRRKVVAASYPTSPQKKMCSLRTHGWKLVVTEL
jgi:hypothetical protein